MEDDVATNLLVLQSHLDGMLDSVKNKSITLKKFQDFEMRLLQLDSLSEIVDQILENAKNYFDLDMITLCLVDETDEIAKLLTADGRDYKARKGLILFPDKEPLQSKLGYTMRAYIGEYKSNVFADFFPGEDREPASIAVMPFIRRGKYLGALNLGSYQVERFAGSMATEFVAHLSSVVSVCLENSLNFETIMRTSFVDTLTGVNNRRFLEQRILEELDRCRRNADPISCLFLDVDYFKKINDQYGHQAGDMVLSSTAKTFKAQLRNNDVLARYGGEEFVALLSSVGEVKAFEIAERIRKSVESTSMNFNDDIINVTVSIGLSAYSPGKTFLSKTDEIALCLINSADAALYKAKHNGRNRVECCDLSADSQFIDNTA